MTVPCEPVRWEVLDTSVLGTGDTVVLRRRGAMFDIRFNGIELMSNADPTSELAFGRAVAGGRDRTNPSQAAPSRVLIGGLGMGFTLRAALDHLPEACAVHVCELVPAVAQWNQNEIGHLAGWPLRDPRVHLETECIRTYLARTDRLFDVIFLDTDNGPDWMVREENAAIYQQEGLREILLRLKPQGVVGYWSATRSEAFAARLAALGLSWTAEPVYLGTPGQEPFHFVYYISPQKSADGRPALAEEIINAN
ncbi:spermidine synthase [Phaeobacter sp. B1627]|uniref:spermidine synthase n=1 Tax=Phaeobacter sp. B1627 TaxID=2583809 RepID=UPI001118469D|nr:hypothetical protein [Phaeobacter sp. B1627]TNJ42314.1 hypothetical protein FGE21_11570 [Phaeobacter sp. B1627]